MKHCWTWGRAIGFPLAEPVSLPKKISKLKFWPDDSSRWKVRGLLKSLAIILQEMLMSVHHLRALHFKGLQTFVSNLSNNLDNNDSLVTLKAADGCTGKTSLKPCGYISLEWKLWPAAGARIHLLGTKYLIQISWQSIQYLVWTTVLKWPTNQPTDGPTLPSLEPCWYCD